MTIREPQATPARRRRITRSTLLAVTFGAGHLLAASAALAQTAPKPPESLARVARPEPANLGDFVANRAAATALGKALFWDMQLGSDGKTACASCHFHAGADSRSKNTLSPGLNRSPTPDTAFEVAGPNAQLKAADFPFHQFSRPDDRNSSVVRSVNDVVGSQGVFKELFGNVIAGQREEARQLTYDQIFHVGTDNTRQVTPRNTPSVINAVFNLRNFWDGRAQTLFNGANPWGKRDPDARVYKNVASFSLLGGTSTKVTPVSVAIDNSSLASQASGPPMSTAEMSATGRSFPDLGRKMLSLRPLSGQQVASDDSLLASYRATSGDGLAKADYAELVKTAFRSEWWNGKQTVSLKGKNYSQIEANFSLFFGLAVQMYEATLVSDKTPFDSYVEGNGSALSSQQAMGLGLFWGKGKCANCHGGAEFTNASIRRKLITDRMSNMIMGDGNRAIYDEGFYNIGITKTAEDLGVGGKDPFGNPLSFSGVAKQSLLKFNYLENAFSNLLVTPLSPISVNGSFKTPGLRNVALTAPYFHNGGAATLMQVVEFYNRGGNFAAANRADLDADIQPLGLSTTEKEALVAFLQSLTDERVRKHAAPFDHPQLYIANGHTGSDTAVTGDGSGRATNDWMVLNAVGRNGYASGSIPQNFLGLK